MSDGCFSPKQALDLTSEAGLKSQWALSAPLERLLGPGRELLDELFRLFRFRELAGGGCSTSEQTHH